MRFIRGGIDLVELYRRGRERAGEIADARVPWAARNSCRLAGVLYCG
jgi:hypothetical protein